jgi:hypothetical protein
MKIIQRQDTILHYSIDPDYFERHNEVERNYSGHLHWKHANDCTYLLNCGLSYLALNKASGEHFIKYESRLMLHCVIDDFETDVFEIIRIREETRISMIRFIEQNSMSFFNRLSFPDNFPLDDRIVSEKRAFYIMTEGKVPADQRTAITDEIEEFLRKQPRVGDKR